MFAPNRKCNTHLLEDIITQRNAVSTAGYTFKRYLATSMGKQNLKTCFLKKAQFKSTQQKQSKDFLYINFVISIY